MAVPLSRNVKLNSPLPVELIVAGVSWYPVKLVVIRFCPLDLGESAIADATTNAISAAPTRLESLLLAFILRSFHEVGPGPARRIRLTLNMQGSKVIPACAQVRN